MRGDTFELLKKFIVQSICNAPWEIQIQVHVYGLFFAQYISVCNAESLSIWGKQYEAIIKRFTEQILSFFVSLMELTVGDTLV